MKALIERKHIEEALVVWLGVWGYTDEALVVWLGV
jgi:hypothetical protein